MMLCGFVNWPNKASWHQRIFSFMNMWNSLGLFCCSCLVVSHLRRKIPISMEKRIVITAREQTMTEPLPSGDGMFLSFRHFCFFLPGCAKRGVLHHLTLTGEALSKSRSASHSEGRSLLFVFGFPLHYSIHWHMTPESSFFLPRKEKNKRSHGFLLFWWWYKYGWASKWKKQL